MSASAPATGFLETHTRTHRSGELRAEHIDTEVVLMGWVATRRDHGGRMFIDLRDRTGIAQVVFGPDVDAAAHTLAGELRPEFCIGVRGRVISEDLAGPIEQHILTSEANWMADPADADDDA